MRRMRENRKNALPKPIREEATSGMERDKERDPPLSEVSEEIISVAFVGSREFQPVSIVHQVMKRVGRCLVISGGARGVDTAAEEAADELGYPKKIMHADWDRYGKSAGPKRNYEMVQESDVAMVFWDGKSKGTMDFMNKAKKKGMPMVLFEVSGTPKKLQVTQYGMDDIGDINHGQFELQQVKKKHSQGRSPGDDGAKKKGSK